MKLLIFLILFLYTFTNLNSQDFGVGKWGDTQIDIYNEMLLITQINKNMSILDITPNKIDYGEYVEPNYITITFYFTNDSLSMGSVIFIINDSHTGNSPDINKLRYLTARHQYYIQIIKKLEEKEFGNPIVSLNDPTILNNKKDPAPILSGWKSNRTIVYYFLIQDNLDRWIQYHIYAPNTEFGKIISASILKNMGFTSDLLLIK